MKVRNYNIQIVFQNCFTRTFGFGFQLSPSKRSQLVVRSQWKLNQNALMAHITSLMALRVFMTTWILAHPKPAFTQTVVVAPLLRVLSKDLDRQVPQFTHGSVTVVLKVKVTSLGSTVQDIVLMKTVWDQQQIQSKAPTFLLKTLHNQRYWHHDRGMYKAFFLLHITFSDEFSWNLLQTSAYRRRHQVCFGCCDSCVINVCIDEFNLISMSCFFIVLQIECCAEKWMKFLYPASTVTQKVYSLRMQRVVKLLIIGMLYFPQDLKHKRKWFLFSFTFQGKNDVENGIPEIREVSNHKRPLVKFYLQCFESKKLWCSYSSIFC